MLREFAPVQRCYVTMLERRHGLAPSLSLFGPGDALRDAIGVSLDWARGVFQSAQRKCERLTVRS